MPKILFIAAHRPGRSPSQRFRFEQYLGTLKENGFDYDFSYLISENEDKKSFFEKQFGKSRAKLVFDFDDSIWLSNVSDANKNLEWLKDYSKTGKIIENSDIVIAGNKYLAKYALNFNQNVKIIPTTIDTDYHKKKPVLDNTPTVCIGWTGTSTTLKHFQLIIPVLKKLKAKYGPQVSFKVIADAGYYSEEIPIDNIKWNKEKEIEDLSLIDIGIMPLPDNDWSKGKCGFKGLQYMSLEIPTVMSPVGVNNEIISDGLNGFLAGSETEWIEKISLLIESKELRKKIGLEARKTIVERYSVESQKGNYLKYLNDILLNP